MKPTLVTLVMCISGAAQADCLEGEQAFMSCQIEDSTKHLRVCFDETTAHYRFGDRDLTPDLELSEPIATVDYFPWQGVGRSIAEGVTFQNQGYTYEAYAGFERMFGDEEDEDVPHRSFGGVRVGRDGNMIAQLQCARETVEYSWGEGLGDAKHALGFSWDFEDRVWVELPD